MENQRNEYDTDSTGTRTAILRKEFGHAWEFWVWLRHQFTPSSVSVILTIVGVAATWIGREQTHVTALATKVTVLETEVVPLLKQNDNIVSMLASVGAIGPQLTAINNRLERLESTHDPRINELEERVTTLEVAHDREVLEARRPLRRVHR